MATITAPKVGEAFLDNAVRFQKVSWGGASGDITITGACVDSDTPLDIDIFEYGPGGIMILGIAHQVSVAFSAGDAITIGGTDTDGWAIAENVAATLAHENGWFYSNYSGSATSDLSHFYSSVSGSIKLGYNAGAATEDSASGTINVGIWYTYGV